MSANDNFELALPKGCILKEVMLLVRRAGIELEADFDDLGSRQLQFATNVKGLEIIRVRSFGVGIFVVFGAPLLSVVGNEVLKEFDCPDLYAPLYLNVSHCRFSVADTHMVDDYDPSRQSSIRIAFEWPNLNCKYFMSRGAHAECIKLNGANEPAPIVELCSPIASLVSTGAMLTANGSIEIEKIFNINSCLTVKRTAWKTRPAETNDWLENLREAVHDLAA